MTGLHARSESTIQTTQDWERGRVGSEKLRAAFRGDIESLVALQDEVGADFVSDGQMTMDWQDFLRPITSGFEGVKKGAMVRWYDTNTFYFTPVVRGPLGSSGEALWNRLSKRLVKKHRMRVVIADPLTFSELAENQYYSNQEELLFAYADALNDELRTLEKKGVSYVQFSSPSLVARFRDRPISREGLSQLGEALRAAKRGISIRTGFHTIFGDASPYLPGIFDIIPTDDIGFDFTRTDPHSLSATRKGLIAGIVDSRTTYLESEDELREIVEEILDYTGTKKLTLAPSSDLRFVPRISADENLRRIGDLRRELAK